MTINLRALYSEMDYMDIEVSSGEACLNRPVKWFNLVENSEQAAALKEYELAVMTGAELSSDNVGEVMKTLAAKGAAGVIWTAPVSDTLTKAAEVCRAAALPLLVVRDGSLAAVMQFICRRLLKAAQQEAELSSAVKHAIYFPQQKDLYVPFFEKHHLPGAGAYCVAIMDIVDGAERTIMPERPEELLNSIRFELLKLQTKAAAVCFESRILLLFHAVKLPEIKQAMTALAELVSQILPPRHHAYVAIGSMETQSDMLHRSYRRSHEVLKLQKWRGSSIKTYDELGIYKLLLAIEDKNIIRSFDQENLRPLAEYDELNNTDYLSVLDCYLRTGGSLKDTAAELFVHRNTVNYKIHKIEEILGCNLNDADERLRLTVAFKLRDII